MKDIRHLEMSEGWYGQRNDRPGLRRSELHDKRRGNTEYFKNLEKEIERMEKEGIPLDQQPARDPRTLKKREAKAPQGQDDGVVVLVPVPLASPDPSCENPVGGGEMSTDTMEKPVKTKKTPKPKAAKPKASKPKAMKPKAKAKNLPRSERKDVPCCINFPRKLLKAIDAAAKKKDGQSRSRFVNEGLAKLVGFKLA